MSTFDIISDSGTGVKALAWFRSQNKVLLNIFPCFGCMKSNYG